jgi:hypothetical protein
VTKLILPPRLRAAFGYANIIADLPVADLVAGYADNWEAMNRAATQGPRERIQIVHRALDLCAVARKYSEEHEFERSLSGLLRAADLMPDAPEGMEWRRGSESRPWMLYPAIERVYETPGIWSAFAVGNNQIIVPALPGTIFQTAPYAISAAATVRRRIFEGHGNPEGVRFADRLDVVIP